MKFLHTDYTPAEIVKLLEVGSKHESIPLRVVEDDKAMRKDLSQAEQKLIDIAHKIYLFEGIEPNEVLKVVNNIKFLRFGMDEIVFTQGENGLGIFFVVSGSIDIKVALDGGKSKTVGMIEAGNIFGEISTISHYPRNATATSKSDSTTLISFDINVDQINQANSMLFLQLYVNIASALAKKLEACNERIVRTSP